MNNNTINKFLLRIIMNMTIQMKMIKSMIKTKNNHIMEAQGEVQNQT